MLKNISILLFLFYLNFSAQTTNEIDSVLQNCLDGNENTAGQRNCLSTAYNAWDKELNKNYVELSKKLPAAAFNTLKESQRNWLKFRDAEFLFINKYYYELKKGTIFYVIGDGNRVQIVKDRALQLAEFNDQIDY